MLLLLGCLTPQPPQILEQNAQWWEEVYSGNYTVVRERKVFYNDTLALAYVERRWRSGNSSGLLRDYCFARMEASDGVLCFYVAGRSACREDSRVRDLLIDPHPLQDFARLKNASSYIDFHQNESCVEYFIRTDEMPPEHLRYFGYIPGGIRVVRCFKGERETYREMEYTDPGLGVKVRVEERILNVSKSGHPLNLTPTNVGEFPDVERSFREIQENLREMAVKGSSGYANTIALEYLCPSYCSNEDCLLDVYVSRDEMKCDEMESLRDLCYKAFAVSRQDPSLCHRIGNASLRRECFQVVQG